MLNLIFSPYYDGNCYAGNPEKNTCELGTKYVGPIGLLNELELRAGLSHGETTPMQRAIAYCNAIEKVKDSTPAPFYQQSFENDPLGVAQQLLRWRDALCMAGWNKDTQLPEGLSADGKNRLSNLQEIESHFNAIGMGERWRALLEESTKRNILPPDVTITVDMKMELLHPVIRKVLETIREKGGQITESEAVTALGNKPLSDFAGKFTLYRFPEQTDAYQWAALQEQIKADVYINEDNFTFNQVLKSVGQPLVAASVKNSIPELSQLLKLGISLFRQPVNFTHLTNYLQIFQHPIRWDTRGILRCNTQKDNGFKSILDSEGHLIPLDNPFFNDQDSSPCLWGMWEVARASNGNVPANAVNDFCDALLDWLKKAKINAAILIENNPTAGVQLHSQIELLEEEINGLTTFIHGRKDISNDELDKAVAIICQGGSVTTDFARLGSYDILKDIKGLAVNDKTVMWMDCVRKPRPRYEYAFLNPADIKKLQDKGLLIPDATLEMQASDFAERLAVSRAKQIIALMPQRKDGERTEENLLVTELLSYSPHLKGNNAKLPTAATKRFTPKNIAPQEVEYEIHDKKLFKNIDRKPRVKKGAASGGGSLLHKVGYQRDHESYTSLTQLINYPFDYLFNYIYDLKEDDSSNLSLIEGYVAHGVFSALVEKSKVSGVVDTSKFIAMCRKNAVVSKLIEKSIINLGAELLLPENKIERNKFQHILSKESIPTLAQIIEENGLEVVGSEMDLTKDVKDSKKGFVFRLNSKIDFVLKKGKKYYIFDFKWTTKPKDRKKELLDCKELQLALYRIILEEEFGAGCVEMCGYYLLKQTKLLTTYRGFVPNNNAIEIVPQEESYNIVEQAAESYRERIQNLKDGFIEEGEDMKGYDFEDTQFFKKYLAESVTLKKVSKSFFIDNKLAITYTQSKNKASMMAPKKESSYKYAVLKNRIK